MKKVLFFMMFISIAVIGYSQDAKGDSPVATNKDELGLLNGTTPISETERIVDKYVGQFSDALTELAKALKVPAEHVYGVLVRQQVVRGISLLIGVLLSLGLSIFLSAALRRRKNSEFDDLFLDEPFLFMGTIIGWVCFVILTAVFLSGGVSSLINPEYGAIKDILSIL